MRLTLLGIFFAVAMSPLSGALAAEPATAQNTAALWQILATLSFPADTRTPFRETRSSKLLRKPVQQTGVLWITDNGEFVMQITEPRQEERRLTQQRLSLIRTRKDKHGKLKSKQRSIALDRSKGAHQLLLSIVDVLEGNIEHLKEHFTVSSQPPVTANNSTWSIALTPKDVDVARNMSQLLLSGERASLRSLRATKSNNSWQQIDLTTRLGTVTATASD